MNDNVNNDTNKYVLVPGKNPDKRASLSAAT
jgi:hypothetical protein